LQQSGADPPKGHLPAGGAVEAEIFVSTAIVVDKSPLEENGLPGDARVQRLRPRRAVDDNEIDITPMIDMTFLLLIFFLVGSKMEQATRVDLPPAAYGVPVALRSAVVLTVDHAGGDGLVAVYRGDGLREENRIRAADLEELEQGIESYVEDAMLQQGNKRHVLIKAAGGVKHRDVARVARAAGRAAQIERLHIGVLEAEPRR
jgi:biopolymer transport protein ExbD